MLQHVPQGVEKFVSPAGIEYSLQVLVFIEAKQDPQTLGHRCLGGVEPIAEHGVWFLLQRVRSQWLDGGAPLAQARADLSGEVSQECRSTIRDRWVLTVDQRWSEIR